MIEKLTLGMNNASTLKSRMKTVEINMAYIDKAFHKAADKMAAKLHNNKKDSFNVKHVYKNHSVSLNVSRKWKLSIEIGYVDSNYIGIITRYAYTPGALKHVDSINNKYILGGAKYIEFLIQINAVELRSSLVSSPY